MEPILTHYWNLIIRNPLIGGINAFQRSLQNQLFADVGLDCPTTEMTPAGKC